MRLHPRSVVNQPLDRIRDLELIARRRLDPAHRLEDSGREEVDPDQGQVRGWIRRLLLESDHLAIAQLRNAKPLRRGDAGEQDERIGTALVEARDETGNAIRHDIVPEVHHEWLVL